MPSRMIQERRVLSVHLGSLCPLDLAALWLLPSALVVLDLLYPLSFPSTIISLRLVTSLVLIILHQLVLLLPLLAVVLFLVEV
jgi:hypothetical protein